MHLLGRTSIWLPSAAGGPWWDRMGVGGGDAGAGEHQFVNE